MKIKWWYFPAALGGAIVVTCALIVFAAYLYAYLNIVAWGCVMKGHKHYDSSEYEEAVKWYDRALKLRPIRKEYIQHDKAQALSKSGRFEEALELYDEALAHFAGTDFIYYVYKDKAEALVGLGKWEEAVEAYGQAIDHTPDWQARDPSFWGDVNFSGKRYAEAIAYFEAAAKSNPDDYNAYYKIGRAWLALEQYEKAASYFDVASELAPDYAPAWERKAWALGLSGRYDAALECADRALALNARYADAWNTKGKILLLSGEAAAARECFDRAFARYPSSPEALEALLAIGITYVAEAKYDEARPYFEGLSGAGGSPYYLLYLYLVDRAVGRPGTDRLQPLLESPPDPWFKNVSLFLIGRIGTGDLLSAAAADKSLLCEAHFFIGYKNKLDGDATAARRHFAEAVATERHDLAEYYLARYELAPRAR